MSAVLEASTLRIAMSGPRGSITTEKVLRADPRRTGAKKSLRTSIRGHSATQNVVCTMPSTRTTDQLSSMAMGHGSASGDTTSGRSPCGS